MKKKYLLIIYVVVIILVVIILIAVTTNNKVSVYLFSKRKNIEYTENVEELKKTVKEAKVPIFMYHNITDDLSYIEFEQNAVSPISFEKQLQEIVNNGYQTMFFSDIDKLYEYSKPVVLTFDDGFEDFYKYVFPLIKKYNIKATLFTIVNYINCSPYCSLDELREMQESGLVQIESHTKSHANLANSNDDKKTEEILDSTNLLNDYLSKEKNSVFCYPYGACDDSTIDLVEQKYSYAVIMGDSIYNYNVHDKYKIPRINVYRSMSISEFCGYLKTSTVTVE